MNFEKFLRPVSPDDLRLALHVAMEAAEERFPLGDRPPSSRGVDMGDGTGYVLNDTPVTRAICAIADTFHGHKKLKAIHMRTWAVLQATPDPLLSQWVRIENAYIAEYVKPFIEVASYYPLNKKNGLFRKGFPEELARVASGEKK